MAAIKTAHRSSDVRGTKNGLLIDRMNLVVAPRKETVVPDHLLATKIYSKVAQNSIVQARPAVVHFGGFELGKTMRQKLFIANVSSDVQRYHVIPPQTKFFNIKYVKNDRLVPGLTLDCVIEFYPEEWRYYYDCIRINCQGDDNLIIPIHAYPVMNTADFPDHLNFPPIPVGERRVKTLPLYCNCPVDFEFSVKIPQHNAAFAIDPMSGIIPAMGVAYINVTFSPSDYNTCQCTIQIIVSQFNAKPLMCVITGKSSPGLLFKELSESSQKESEDAASVLDPSTLSLTDRSRRKKKTRRHRTTSGGDKPQEIEKNGLKFPAKLNTPYAVACVLNQEPGKLRVKDMREAIVKKETTPSQSRQMKEAMFEQAVRQNVHEERQNQLRWQVRLGDVQITTDDKLLVLEQRDQAWSEYKAQRGDPDPASEYNRTCTNCVTLRNHRDYDKLGAEGVTFDLYKNDPWAVKYSVLNKFSQAARTVIIRTRARTKLDMLSDMVHDISKRKPGAYHSSAHLIQAKDEIEPEVDLGLLSLSRDKVTSVIFPQYKDADRKDDMAPDAVEKFAVAPTKVVVKHKVPYYDLKVPQYYKLNGYSSYSVQEAARGYVPPGIARKLRTGAEDEVIHLPDHVPEDHRETFESCSGFAKTPAPPAATSATKATSPEVVTLKMPETLLTAPEYHPLHIFNPSPGLQMYYAPLPYSETDPDYHLCPLPRYDQSHLPQTSHTTTQKTYLDHEEVIKGVMTWRKLPSAGLATLNDTPALADVWLPRWTDPFSADLLPYDTPPLLTCLPDDVAIDCDSESRPVVELTPAVVEAQFPMPDTKTPVDPESKEFPYGDKLPATNSPDGADGTVSREQREKELDYFIRKRFNRLGDSVHRRVDHLDSLKTDTNLILK